MRPSGYSGKKRLVSGWACVQKGLVGQAGVWALTLQLLSWWGGPGGDVTGAEPCFTHYPRTQPGEDWLYPPWGWRELGLTRTLTFEICVKMVRNLHLIVFMLSDAFIPLNICSNHVHSSCFFLKGPDSIFSFLVSVSAESSHRMEWQTHDKLFCVSMKVVKTSTCSGRLETFMFHLVFCCCLIYVEKSPQLQQVLFLLQVKVDHQDAHSRPQWVWVCTLVRSR